jgi:uncharacterized protein
MSVVRALAALLVPAFLVLPIDCRGSARADAPLSAAGFDCDSASGIDERIICSDPLLRRTDADLAKRYEELIRGAADSAYIATLRGDEHGWIMVRNKECHVTKATKVTDDNRGELVDCFLDSYAERLVDLDQMQANPGADPVTISAPIRKSLFSSAGTVAALPAGALIDTGLFAESVERPLIAWQPDGGLAVLGKGADSTGAALYLWQEGKPSALLVPQVKKPARIERICARGRQIYLIGRDAPLLQVTVASGAVREVAASELPPDAIVSCGLDPSRRVTGDTAGMSSLVVGPAQGADGQGERLVQWRNNGESRDVDPAVRIDRRYPLTAVYLPFSQSYVVAAAQWPAEMRAATERRWAKTNCLPYWLVEAKTGKANRQCVPYGDYIGPAPQPLPTVVGVYFTVHGVGLYRIGDAVSQLIFAGQTDGAAVSADGCRIAFAGAPLKDGHPAVKILDVCRAARGSA